MTTTDHVPGERAASEPADLLNSLAKQRYFLRFTVRGLTDEQAAQHSGHADIIRESLDGAKSMG
jgi:hypothetical protein